MGEVAFNVWALGSIICGFVMLFALIGTLCNLPDREEPITPKDWQRVLIAVMGLLFCVCWPVHVVALIAFLVRKSFPDGVRTKEKW